MYLLLLGGLLGIGRCLCAIPVPDLGDPVYPSSHQIFGRALNWLVPIMVGLSWLGGAE